MLSGLPAIFILWDAFGRLRGGRQGGAGYGAAPPSRPPLHPPRSTPLSYPDQLLPFFGGGYARTSPTCRLRFFMTPPPATAIPCLRNSTGLSALPA